MEKEDLYKKLRTESWKDALTCFGYEYIFNKRASRISSKLNWLTVFGLLVPAIIGATVLGYGLKNDILTYLIAIAIPITIFQFAFSVWSVIYKWGDELSYSYEAAQCYGNLSNRFKKLGGFPPADYNDFRQDFELLESELIQRGQQDSKHNIAEWERRMGMRFALREFQNSCVGCNTVPLSMVSTNCAVCGNFSLKYKLLNL